MTQHIAPQIVRIILRYLSMALVTWGVVSPDTAAAITADPEINGLLLMLVGGALAAITEAAWIRAVVRGDA